MQPSLGGWSLSDPFPAMAANEQSRLNFADNCIKLVEEMNFDG
jgi:chitinase